MKKKKHVFYERNIFMPHSETQKDRDTERERGKKKKERHNTIINE